MANLTREQILARKTGKGTATLPDGSTMAIRALTRDELFHMDEIPVGGRDIYAISRCVTDPKLSEDDVTAWAAEGAAGDFAALITAIRELSGLNEGAGKSGVAAA
jgi:hypothetical protein